jgi:hypothetical protein
LSLIQNEYVKNVFMPYRKLVLYPNGNKNRNVKDHISLYLALDESSSLHPGWEIYVNFRLFLFDHNNDNYLVVQGIYNFYPFSHYIHLTITFPRKII